MTKVTIIGKPGEKIRHSTALGAGKKLDACIEVTWLLLIFLLPVYFNPLGYEVFYLAKSLLLQFTVCVLLGFYAAQLFVASDKRPAVPLATTIKQSPLQIAVLVFGVFWIISTIFSITPEASLWGSLARKDGLISIIAWITFFLIVADKMRQRAQVYRALYMLVFSSSVVCIIGILQFIDPRFLAWFSFNDRISSTDGNPLSFSAFIAMVMPVNLALAVITWYRQPVDSKRNIKLTGFLIIFVLQMACLCLAQYSVTLLLFIPGIFLFLLLTGIFLHRKATVLLSSVALLSLLALAAVLLGQLAINRAVKPPSGKTQQSVTVADSVGLNTLDRRLSIWKCAFNVICDSPEVPFYTDNYHGMRRLIGYGPETFVILSQTRFPASLRSEDAYNSTLTGQPENHYLYLGATIGILGLAAFIAVILLFLYLVFRIFRSRADREILILSAAFVAGIAQYCAYILFNPTAVVPELTFWLILSLTVVVGRIAGSNDAVNAEQMDVCIQTDISGSPPVSKSKKCLAILIIVVSVITGFTLIKDTLLADIKLSTAVHAWPRDITGSMNAFIDATNLEPREAVYSGYMGSRLYILAVLTENPAEKQKMLDLSASTYEKARGRESYLAYWSYKTADVYAYQANNCNPGKWADALRLYERSDVQLPGNAVILNKWALALMLKGDYSEAGQKLAEAGKVDPVWSQTFFYEGLLKSFEGNREAGEMFVLSEKGHARLLRHPDKGPNDIDYFINFCNEAALYGVIDRVADDLKYYVDDNSDWIAWTFQGIADIYAERAGEAIDAFSTAADLIPTEDIVSSKGVIIAIPWNNHVLQAAANDITASLSARQTK